VSAGRALKGALGGALYGTGLHRLALRNRAVIAVFHRIDDRYPDNPITLSSAFFRRLCDFFAANFTVIPLSRLVGMLGAGAELGGHLAITFDDGYRDNFRVAAPYLEIKGLPASFFVTTGFIGSGTIPWWDQEQGIGSEWMDWNEVRSLHERGFEIGAHTVHHVDLSHTDGSEADAEIAGGKRMLEERLGAVVNLFAYPYGRRHQITEANRSLVREVGFACCASSYGGTVGAGDDPFRLRRLPATNWHRSPGQYGFEAAFSRWE
jgi:peptidoglycan/xylan/chitin deacetylase (PgdA/CDA1 family)